MKKNLFLYLLLAFTWSAGSMILSSCGDDEESPVQKPGHENDGEKGDSVVSIVGEWSGVRSVESIGHNDLVYVHFSLKKDGTFEQILPAWEEKRIGTYSVKGDIVTFTVTELQWLWNRNNGYDNVYDQYGCYWYPEKYAENARPYENPHKVWQENWAQEAYYSCRIKEEANGYYSVETISGSGAGMGLNLIYYSDPNFSVVPLD